MGDVSPAYVGSGSFASKAAEAVSPCTSAAPPKADVNLPPWLPPLSAITGRAHLQQSSLSLFDHLIGTREQRVWHRQAERLCGLEINH
jgi:hypothetical protein